MPANRLSLFKSLKSCLLFVFALALPATLQCGTTPMHPPSSAAVEIGNNSILRVNSTNQRYDFFRPWTKKAPYARRGLGALIEGGRILVTAELIANHTYIELEKAATAEKCPAMVEHVDYGCNLAVLKASNPDFLKGMKPLVLDKGMKVGNRVMVLQLESNGEIAQTAGTLTSIAIGLYPFDNMGLLVFRVSAPLQQRDGSFTLPVVRNGRLLGLLMRYDPRSQTADLISTPVIKHFLDEAAKEPYRGFAKAGLEFSPTRDPQLRRYIGLQEPGGVYVTNTLNGCSAQKAGIQKGDVILAIDGRTIDQDGNYEDPDFGRITFSHIINTKAHPGDTLNFKIFRSGKIIELPVKLDVQDRSKLVSEPYVVDDAPKYVVVGGLVFLELSRPFLQEWGPNWPKEAPQRLVYYDAFQDELSPDRGKIVFLAKVLPTSDTLGYEDFKNLVVSKVNGRDIKSLSDLVDATKYPVNGFQKIEFEEDPGVLFLDADAVKKNQDALMRQYALPSLQRL